jgi:cytoskeletal protein CcmA (bactofilin family)
MGMWGRKDEEDPKPVSSVRDTAQRPEPAKSPAPQKGAVVEKQRAVIGPSIQVKGELIGDEDLVIEGRVEGVVRLQDQHLIIGKSAQIDATLEAKSIRIEGNVNGDVMANERVELAAGSTLTGDIVSPRMMIADGARFKGSVDMDKAKPGASSAQPAQSAKSAASAQGTKSSAPASPGSGGGSGATKPAGVS